MPHKKNDSQRQSKSGSQGVKGLWRNLNAFLSGQAPAAPRTFSLGHRRPAPAPLPSVQQKTKKTHDLDADLQRNLERIKAEFHYPVNSDVLIREFAIATTPPIRAAVLCIEGLADRKTESETILQPLMVFAKLNPNLNRAQLLDGLKGRLIPGSHIEELHSFAEAFTAALTGTTVLFVDGADYALNIETKGWEHRTVERPQSEVTIRGPQDSFTETLRTNTALVRRRLRTPRLIVEAMKVGNLSETDVAILYLDGLTNPKLVAEVRRRIMGLDVDYLADADTLEQFIQDRPNSIFPQLNSTERPDRIAAALTEGNVAILVDNSPIALFAPIFFTAFLHNPEDYYLRWPFATFTRLIRVLGFLTTVFLPGLYIAVTNYHQDMLPPALTFAIAAARESVPFPVVAEVLVMEIAFELVREAGLRIPSVIGPTIGILGALVLGQAAVAANIVSPILVIIVAMTALGSFVIPHYPSSWSIRILRFVIIGLASVLGFVGIGLGIFAFAMHLSSLQTFGVPFMSPVAPFRTGNPDLIIRGPTFEMERRPAFLRPLDLFRQPKRARRWDSPPEGDGNQTDRKAGKGRQRK